MIDIDTEVDALASWPTRERIRALKRIIPRARVEEVLARTGRDRPDCPRLPGWFMVWFVIALGLFCRDCYRQVFRWLQPFRPNATRPAPPSARPGNASASPPCVTWPKRPSACWDVPRRRGPSTAAIGPWPSTGSSSTCPIRPQRRAFGRPGGRRARRVPQARVLALCETGSHVLWRWLIKPYPRGEVPWRTPAA